MRNRIEEIEALSSEKSEVLSTIILRRPDVVIFLLKIVWAVVKFALTHMMDKNGNPKNPFWLRLASFLGIGAAKELQVIAKDALVAHDVIAGTPEGQYICKDVDK